MPSQTPDGNTDPRNPYEMRFELLHLAKEILEQNAHMAREDKTTDPTRKTYFTTAEVIETAGKLKEFIGKK